MALTRSRNRTRSREQSHPPRTPDPQTDIRPPIVALRDATVVYPDGHVALERINLEIQGNTDAFLHAHVTPRYHWEPDDIVGWPAALHHWTERVGPEHAVGPQHDELRAELRAELDLVRGG